MRQKKRLFKKDYKRKKYRNPFFVEKKKKKQAWRLMGQVLAGAFVLALFGAGFWFICYSSYFLISDIQIQGSVDSINKQINSYIEKKLKEKKYFILPQKNIFLFNADKAKSELSSLYFFSQLNIKKDYPHTLIIAYQQSQPAFIWLENGQYYYLDKAGHVLTPAKNQAEKKHLILIENTTTPKIKGQQLEIGKDQLNFILNLAVNLDKYSLPAKIDRLRIDNSEYAITLVLEKGPLIYFNTRLNSRMQLEKLSLVIKEKIKDDFFKKQYIDLRYGDMVYVK